MYKCTRCDYTTDKKFSMKTHSNRKTPCGKPNIGKQKPVNKGSVPKEINLPTVTTNTFSNTINNTTNNVTHVILPDEDGNVFVVFFGYVEVTNIISVDDFDNEIITPFDTDRHRTIIHVNKHGITFVVYLNEDGIESKFRIADAGTKTINIVDDCRNKTIINIIISKLIQVVVEDRIVHSYTVKKFNDLMFYSSLFRYTFSEEGMTKILKQIEKEELEEKELEEKELKEKELKEKELEGTNATLKSGIEQTL